MKKNILLMIVTAIIFTGIGVFATIQYQADEIGYGTGTIKDAIDDLYSKVGTGSSDLKFCELKSGTANTVGAKYECDPGDSVKRNFYVLTVRTNSVDLIMENNITDTVGSARTMTWYNAMKFFRTGDGATIKSTWTNIVDIDLPKAQAIGDAVNNTSWVASDANGAWWCLGSRAQDKNSLPYCTNANQETYAWLYNHLTGCTQSGCTDDSNATSEGYWTRDLVYNTTKAWFINWTGYINSISTSNSGAYGVRPVITVLKSNLINGD